MPISATLPPASIYAIRETSALDDAFARISRPQQFVAQRPPRQLEHEFYSKQLDRRVRLSIILPPYYRLSVLSRYPLVLLNDGQDFPALGLFDRLQAAYAKTDLRPRIIVGMHADENRMREYGSSSVMDHAGRGDLAAAHRRFVTTELLPWLRREFRISRRRQDIAIGGFSLGGLSAFDIAWQHAHTFGAVGCFSASFWMRSAPFRRETPDGDRIVIDLVRNAAQAPNLDYWFMAGDREEEADRNGNGVIDVIDDTQDVITALRSHGIPEDRIGYEEVLGGEHNQRTWGPMVMQWLRWLER